MDPTVYVPLHFLTSADFAFRIGGGSSDYYAADRLAEITRTIDGFLAKHAAAGRNEDLSPKAVADIQRRVATEALAALVPASDIGRAVDATLAELDGVRAKFDSDIEKAFDSWPAARLARATATAADIAANVLSTEQVGAIAAAMNAGDRDAVEAGLLLSKFGTHAPLRATAEKVFTAKFVSGGERRAIGVDRCETMAAILRLAILSARRGLADLIEAANLGRGTALAQPDADVLVQLGAGLDAIELRARKHGFSRAAGVGVAS